MSRRIGWLVLSVVLPLLSIALSPATTLAQEDVVWRRDVGAQIERWWLALDGSLMVETPNGLVAMAPDSGRVRWVRAIPDSLVAARIIAAGHYLIATERAIAALDPSTGAAVWQRDRLPRLDGGGVEVDASRNLALVRSRNGIAMLDLATGETRWDSTRLTGVTAVRDAYWYRDLGVVLLVARTAAQGEAAIVTVAADSGAVVGMTGTPFTQPPVFKRYGALESVKNWVNPLPLPDSGFVIYFSKEGPLRLDRNGAVLWRAEELAGASIPADEDDYPRLRLVDSLLIVAQGKTVVALRLENGRVAWRSKEYRDKPTWVRPVGEHDLLVGGFGRFKSFVSVIRRGDGLPVWPQDLELTAAARALVHRDTLFLVDRDAVVATPLASGVSRELGKVDFWDSQAPVAIDTIGESALLLSNREHLMRMESDGRLGYLRYFKAPGASFMTKLATSALIVGLSAASIATSSSTGVYLVPTGYNPSFGARYGQVERLRCLWVAFTETPDSRGREGFSLVVLDRTNGEEIDRMWFANRSPDYRVGPLRGQVYVREGSVITARKFGRPLDVCPTEPEPAPPPTPEAPPAVVVAPSGDGQGR